MNHQDWNPVVIHGKTLPSQKAKVPHREVTKAQKLDQTRSTSYNQLKMSRNCITNGAQKGRNHVSWRVQMPCKNACLKPRLPP